MCVCSTNYKSRFISHGRAYLRTRNSQRERTKKKKEEEKKYDRVLS